MGKGEKRVRDCVNILYKYELLCLCVSIHTVPVNSKVVGASFFFFFSFKQIFIHIPSTLASLYTFINATG